MRPLAQPALLLLTLLAPPACGAKTGLAEGPGANACADAGATRPCQNACGTGIETCVDGRWQDCTAPKPKSGSVPELTGTLRDFRDEHPDFEQGIIASDPGIVEPLLGPDEKPVYTSLLKTPTTNGQTAFYQWYRDIPGVNISQPYAIPLTPAKGSSALYEYIDPSFFPLDDQGFGNQGRPHNYHFTYEIVTSFRYLGGETFSFKGDDDLFVFINRRLAIDLGGIHGAESAIVDLDKRQTELQITPGNTYPLHFFFAERQTTASHFQIKTSISTFLICE